MNIIYNKDISGAKIEKETVEVLNIFKRDGTVLKVHPSRVINEDMSKDEIIYIKDSHKEALFEVLNYFKTYRSSPFDNETELCKYIEDVLKGE
jgi:hypothetical protein